MMKKWKDSIEKVHLLIMILLRIVLKQNYLEIGNVPEIQEKERKFTLNY